MHTDQTNPNAQAQQPRTRKRMVLAIRIAVTLALIAVLARLVDWGEAVGVIARADPVWLAAALAAVIAARLIITARWAVLLAALGQRPALTRLNDIVFASLSLGVLIPSAVGMDVARGVMLSLGGKPTERPPRAVIVSSLLLDRAVATIGTLAVAVVGAAILGEPLLAVGLAVATLAASLSIAAVATGLGGKLAARIPLVPGGIRAKLDRLFTLFATPGIIPRGVAPSLVLSLALTACRTLLFVFLYKALGEPVPTTLAFVVIPLLLVAMMIPVAIGGFGLREGILAASFAAAGISTEVSVAVGVLSVVLQHAVSLPFAIKVTLGQRARPAPAADTREAVS